MTPGLDVLVSNSDPANLALLGVVWWRLDRRLKTLRSDISTERSESA